MLPPGSYGLGREIQLSAALATGVAAHRSQSSSMRGLSPQLRELSPPQVRLRAILEAEKASGWRGRHADWLCPEREGKNCRLAEPGQAGGVCSCAPPIG